MWGFPNIEQMFINALENFFGMIAGALNSVAKWFIKLCLVFLTDTPAPVSDSGSFTNNPDRIFRGCAEYTNGGYDCNAAWNAAYGVYVQAKEYGLVLLVLGILMSQASIPLQGMRKKTTTSSSKLIERSILGIIAIELWWTLGAFVLEIASALAEGIGSIGINNYIDSFGAIGSGSLAFILVGIVLYTVAISTILVIVLFWILRYIAIFMLMGIMPVIIGLWAFKVGPLDTFSSRAGEIAQLFTPLAFASVPAAIVIWAGSFFLEISGQFATNVVESGANVSGSTLGLLTSIVSLILALVLPIVAGLAPLAFFRENNPNSMRYSMDNVMSYKDGVSDRLETATERHTNVKRQASAARAAYQGQGPVKFTDDGVAQQAQSWGEAATGGRAIHSLRSGGSKGKQISKKAADVAGTAVFNPSDTGKAVGVMTQNKISDTKQSLSEATDSAGSSYKDTLKQTAAKKYEAQYALQDWKEERSNMSSTEVLEEMQGASEGVKTSVGGAIESAGDEAHQGIFKSDADATNPRLIDDEGNPIKTPDGFEDDYVTQNMKDEFQTDAEGNIVTDEQGVAQVPEPDIETSSPTYITNEKGEQLTNDKGEPIEAKDAYRYEQNSKGEFMLEDGDPVPKEAVKEGPDKEPLKAEPEGGEGDADEWVTPSRVQRGEYVTDDDLDEDVPDDRKVKVSVLDEGGRTVKTVIKNEDGNIMKKENHRFSPSDTDSNTSNSTGDES